LLFPDHARPVTRRDFLRQGLLSGMGVALGGSLFSLFANPRSARAALSSDITDLAASIGCSLGGTGNNPIPFICFDLAGGANIAGSNVLVGRNTQLDMLTTAGYSKLGLPGDMIPGGVETGPNPSNTSNGDFTDSTLGLVFHSDSMFLRGILEKLTDVNARRQINGTVIPARSDNDTGNNPHNPMYGIARAGGDGSVVTLIGSRSSDSGGNSMAPATMINAEVRPTKVDRATDVTGMVDTGDLTAVLSDPRDVTAVMESVARISKHKMDKVSAYNNITANDVVRDLVNCGYLKAADLADRFAGRSIDPLEDGNIVDGADPVNVPGPGIFTMGEILGDREFEKTASVMKMVIDGHAGAGTISMGGYDYHTGDRVAGERRDLRAGRCMGACLEYAARMSTPLMLYVFSDGSVASNGTIDNTPEGGPDDPGGRGKGVWTGDNSSTAASFMLFYDPNAGGRPSVIRDQIGFFRGDGSVETASSAAANNVNLLAETVILNYLALQGREGDYASLFSGLGANPPSNLIAFSNIL
jgi:hypothetical protein